MMTVGVTEGRTSFDIEIRKRWRMSFIVALGLHVAPLALLASLTVHRLIPQAPPPAIMIDMMPMLPAPVHTRPAEPDVTPPKKTDIQHERLPVMEKAEVPLNQSQPEPRPVRPELPEIKPLNTSKATSPAAAAPVLTVSPVEAVPTATPNYLSALFEHLERYKRYPRVFGERSNDFVVLVHVELDRKGKILLLAIKKSSGNTTYDAAALSTFRRADPLPPFPSSMTQSVLSLNIPVRFTQSD